jgi:hypothetical protein
MLKKARCWSAKLSRMQRIRARADRWRPGSPLPVLQPRGHNMQETSPHRATPGQPPWFAGLERAEQYPDRKPVVPVVGDEGIAFDADAKRDALGCIAGRANSAGIHLQSNGRKGYSNLH